MPAGTYTINLISLPPVPNPPTVVLAAGQSVTGIVITLNSIVNPSVDLIFDLIQIAIEDAKQLQNQCDAQIDYLKNLLKSLDANRCPEAEAEYQRARKEIQKVLGDFQFLKDLVDTSARRLADALALAVTDPVKAKEDLDNVQCLCSPPSIGCMIPISARRTVLGAVDAFYAAVVEKCKMPPKPPPSPQPPVRPPAYPYLPTQVIASDPNEKTGPGVGAAGFVPAGAMMPYSVAFENDPKKATAAAQEVTVTDALSPNLDWTTFTLGDITFGANFIAIPAGLQSYTTSVDTTNTDGTPLRVDVSAGINPATGVVTWTFRSIDPATGQLPTGAQDGFLPIDDATGRGLGTVYYDVKPRAGLATGTTISNTASIVFDTNASLDTAAVVSTIDAGAPTSSVNPLPATSGPRFTVSWAGLDDKGGSGIATFNVFVSTDGGPYTVFLAGTAATSASFNGVAGHRYAFSTTAVDHVGNVQPSLSAPSVTTVTTVANLGEGPRDHPRPPRPGRRRHHLQRRRVVQQPERGTVRRGGQLRRRDRRSAVVRRPRPDVPPLARLRHPRHLHGHGRREGRQRRGRVHDAEADGPAARNPALASNT